MNFADIVNSIANVGFPIVMCIIMFKYMEKNDDKREAETKEMCEAINNNTIVMTQLVDKFDKNG